MGYIMNIVLFYLDVTNVKLVFTATYVPISNWDHIEDLASIQIATK